MARESVNTPARLASAHRLVGGVLTEEPEEPTELSELINEVYAQYVRLREHLEDAQKAAVQLEKMADNLQKKAAEANSREHPPLTAQDLENSRTSLSDARDGLDEQEVADETAESNLEEVVAGRKPVQAAREPGASPSRVLARRAAKLRREAAAIDEWLRKVIAAVKQGE